MRTYTLGQFSIRIIRSFKVPNMICRLPTQVKGFNCMVEPITFFTGDGAVDVIRYIFTIQNYLVSNGQISTN